jgi:hypothetical protein
VYVTDDDASSSPIEVLTQSSPIEAYPHDAGGL